jgi:DNA-binding NarL/FixJ family response regulator
LNSAHKLTAAELRRYCHYELFQIGLDELRREALIQRSRREVMPLTQQQRRIASMLADGFSRTEIAAVLGIDKGTIKTHLMEVYRRLDLDDLTFTPRVRLGVYWNCELFQIGLDAIAA